MIQFNLLPDVKLEYIRAQRLKRSVVGIAILAAAGALFILILLVLVVNVFQKQHLRNLNNGIKTDTEQLQTITDLDKVLTIQGQLSSLTPLHDKKPVASRLFGYLKQVVPNSVSISELGVDFEAHTIKFSGTADKLSSVNRFVDTLKFTTYITGASKGDWVSGSAYKVGEFVAHHNATYVATTDNTADANNEPGVGEVWKSTWGLATNAFSGVVMSSFTRNDLDAKYQVDVTFNPEIFDSSKRVRLVVPKITTTRSETGKPSVLFKELSPGDDNSNNVNGQPAP